MSKENPLKPEYVYTGPNLAFEKRGFGLTLVYKTAEEAIAARDYIANFWRPS